jgi:hypothetical protein
LGTIEVAEAGQGVGAMARASLPRWTVVRRTALALYALAFVIACWRWGLPFQRELVIGWTCGALACASIGRPPRAIVQLALDWLPIVAILVAYDFSRGAADTLGMPVHTSEMIDADRALFGGHVPTEWLQARLLDLDAVHWWDVFFSLVHSSHYWVPFAVAGALWAKHRQWFIGYMRRFVSLSFAGLATYMLYPAAPPWLAAQNGELAGVTRTTARGWRGIDFHAAQLFEKGSASVNQVAAVPSLHAAFAALVAIFLWRKVQPAWRPLLAAYALAMGLALVATGEHYAVDVFLGWIYAALVMAGWTWWERRRPVPRPPMVARFWGAKSEPG